MKVVQVHMYIGVVGLLFACVAGGVVVTVCLCRSIVCVLERARREAILMIYLYLQSQQERIYLLYIYGVCVCLLYIMVYV